MDLKSNEPFWLMKNGILSSYPSLHEDLVCDVLIIGGGITGALIAHQCVNDGFKTILIDKREIANGSSSATTAMLQYEVDKPLYVLQELIGEKQAQQCYWACYDAIDQLEQVCKDIKSKAGFRRKKSLYFAAHKKDVTWLHKEYLCRKEAGFNVKWLEAKDIVKKYDLQHTYAGILSDQGASVDAFMLVHEILDFNINKGLKVFDKTALKTVKYGSKYNECTLSTGAKIKAKKTIYCVGYESASMLKEKFVNLISTYAVVSEIDERNAKKYKDLLIWNTADPYIYMRTTDDHRMLIGGEDEKFRDPVRRDRLLEIKENKLINSYNKIRPHAIFNVDFTWAGTFGETKDSLPYIGSHPDFLRSYFVLGFGGNGITFSVTGMQMVSKWLKNKKHPLSEYFAFGR